MAALQTRLQTKACCFILLTVISENNVHTRDTFLPMRMKCENVSCLSNVVTKYVFNVINSIYEKRLKHVYQCVLSVFLCIFRS